MGLFSNVKGFFARIFGGGEVSAMASDPIITPDFSQEYVPFRAEDGKFVVANTDHDTFSGYPSSGDGKYVMLTYSINDYNMLDFTEPYVPFRAEDGKFVKLNVPESLGYPLSGAGKYAVLTYNVNPPGLSGGEVGGDLTIIGGLSTDCGNDAEWCSTYTTVCANSALWQGAVGGGIVTINSQIGPAITIDEAGIIDVNTSTNTITISARQLSASDIFDFDIEVCNNPCVSSIYSTVSTSSAFWDSTYTSVCANSAIWSAHSVDITAINSQTGPSIVINEAGIIDVNTTANTITISARQLSSSDIFDFDTAVCNNSCVSSLSLSSDYWNSTYTTVSTNSAASWTNQPAFSAIFIPGSDTITAANVNDSFTVVGGGAVTVTGNNTTNTITISTTPESGEANRGQNLGTGEGVYAGMNGVNLTFKSLSANDFIGLNATSDVITITARQLSSSDITDFDTAVCNNSCVSSLSLSSEYWNSTYTTVSANSAIWTAHSIDVTAINGQTGPAIVINEAGIIDVNTTPNTITISARQLSASDIFDFDTAVCNNSCVSSLSLSSDYWNSTYTTVSANSAIWTAHSVDITAINGQTGPAVTINEAGIIDINTTANTITVSARQLSASDIFDFDTAVCNNSCVSSLSLSSDYWNSTYTTVSANSAIWTAHSIDVTAINGQTGPSITISGIDIIGINTDNNVITITARDLSASDITDFDTEVCNNLCVSSLSLSSDYWNSTYTTVSANSATWGQGEVNVPAFSAILIPGSDTISATNVNDSLTLAGAGAIIVTSDNTTNTITISTTPESGEANRGENLGTGEFVYAGMNGVNLTFKSLSANDFIGLNATSDVITITARQLSASDISDFDTAVCNNSCVSSLSLSSDYWNSTYTTVSTNSAIWTAHSVDITAINSQTGPAITINEAGIIDVNTSANTITISARQLSASDIFNFDTAVCNNSCVSSLSLSSDYWNSTYTTVSANSAIWNAHSIDITAINAQTGPAITINEAGIIDVNTSANTITISARQLSASDIFDFDTAVCNNSCVSSLSLSSDYWNSTYTTVSANSAIWNAHSIDITAINGQTGPAITINEAGIIDVITTPNTITVSARQLSSSDIFDFDTAVCSNSCVSSLSLSSDYWNSTYTTVSTNSAASWTNQPAFSAILVQGSDTITAANVNDSFTLSAGGAIILTSDNTTNTILISTTPESGEANRGQNLGTGEFVYAGMNGVNLTFKSLSANDFIGLNATSDVITITARQLSASDVFDFDTAVCNNSCVSSLSLSSDYWNSTYTTVSANSAIWNAHSIDITAINGQTGPSVTISGIDVIGINTDSNVITITARQLSASDIFDFDTAVCNNSCVSSLSLSSDYWNSTYTTVSANSAIWNAHSIDVTAINAQTGPEITISGIDIIGINTSNNVITVTARQLSASDIFDFDTAVCNNSCVSSLLLSSDYWNSTYTTVSANSATWSQQGEGNQFAFSFIDAGGSVISADQTTDLFTISGLTSGVMFSAVQPDIITLSVDLSAEQIAYDLLQNQLLSTTQGPSSVQDVINNLYFEISSTQSQISSIEDTIFLVINSVFDQGQGGNLDPTIGTKEEDPTAPGAILAFITWEGADLYGKQPFAINSINSTDFPTTSGAMRIEDHATLQVLASSEIFSTNAKTDTRIFDWVILADFPVNKTDLAVKLWKVTPDNNPEIYCSNIQIVV